MIPLSLDRQDTQPAYRQIYQRLRDAILAGDLAPGARLPSTRSLASQLATARGTVSFAYELLAGEGYILARGAAGTIVDPELGARRRGARGPAMPRRAAPPATPAPAAPLPFQMGLPALDAFPRKLWSRLAARRARGLAAGALAYQDPAGAPALRRALVAYLGIARGIACRAEQIFVTAGFQGALGLIAQTLLRRDDQVWIEDPGYFLARQALALAGARLVPVPVDRDGLDVAAGIARAGAARFAVVTPAHQAPLGVMLALPRRLALLAWAARAGAWIIEDDYDSEFRYRGRPLPALKSLDERGRVVYAGTFSKVLFPGLRLGYLVVPDPLVERFALACALLQPQAAPLPQAIAAEFITEGHFARHIRRMRQLYADRRAALVAALRAQLALAIDSPPGGMHVLARLPAGTDDQALAARARDAGLAPSALSAAAIEAACGAGLLLSFTNIAATDATRAVRRLGRVLSSA
jgi:GntR family transcriptional regulator/MocR family aminotransferase